MTTSGRWRAIGKKVTGASHIRAGSGCQDAIYIETGERFVIAAVADGHGSKACPHSSEGAEIAVLAAAKVLRQVLEHDLGGAMPTFLANKDVRIPKQLEITWKEEVRAHHRAMERDDEACDLALFTLYGTTLLAVAAAPGFAFFVKIGDGDILMMQSEGTAQLLEQEEKVGEDTESLCLEEAWKYVRTQLVQLKDGRPLMFLVSTDGYSNSFTGSAGFMKAGEDFFGLWENDGLEAIDESLEDWLRRSSDAGSGDDISLALVVRE